MTSTAEDLARFFDAVPDAYAHLDSEFRYTFVNRALEALLGVGRRQLLDRVIWDVRPEIVGTVFERHYRRVMTSRIAETFEAPREPGGQLDEVMVIPMSDGGILVRISCIETGVKLRATPRESQAFLQAIFDTANDPIWSVDSVEFGLLAWNRAFEERFLGDRGIAAGIGMRPQDLFPTYPRDVAQEWRDLYVRALRVAPSTVDYRLPSGARLEVTLNRLESGGRLFGISVLARDVTIPKDAEEARQDAEKRYREVLDGASEGIFRAQPDGALVTANPSFARMLDYRSTAEMLSLVTDVRTKLWFDERERARARACIERDGLIQNYECRFQRKDGSPVWVSLKGRLVRNADTRPRFYECFAEDIDARKRAELALRKSEERFRTVYERAPLGIGLMDSDKAGFLQVNPAYCRIAGRSPEEMSRLSLAEITHPDDISADLEDMRRLRAGDIMEFQKDKRYVRPDGSIVWVSLTVVPLREPHGPATVHMAMVEDITERKGVEAALREAARFNQQIIDSAREGIIVYGFDHRYRVWNRFMEELTGMAANDVLGRYPTDVFPFLAEAGFIQRLENVLAGGSSEAIDFRYTAPTGRSGWVENTTGPLRNAAGDIVGVLATVHDMNAAKRAEESLRESQEKFRAVFMYSPDALYLSALEDGRLIDVNEAYERLFGYSRDELIGQTVLELNLYAEPADRARVAGELRAKHRVRGIELKGRKKDGELFIGVLSAVVVTLDGKQYTAGAVQDVTQWRNARETLRSNEARLRALVRILQYRAATVQEFLDHSLNEAIGLTASGTGYIYRYSEDRQEFRLSSWPGDTRRNGAAANPQTRPRLSDTGGWGDAVRRRRPVVSNRLESGDPCKEGYPEGSRLTRFLTVPVFRGERIVAVVGVANKESDYDETDVLQLTLLMDSVWKSVDIMETEERLRKADQDFLAVVKCAPDTIWSRPGRQPSQAAALQNPGTPKTTCRRRRPPGH